MVDQIKGWMVPFHYELNDCRGMCYPVMGADGDFGWLMSDAVVAKQVRVGAEPAS